MKQIKIFLFLITAMLVCSCSNDMADDIPQLADGKYIYDMQFDGDVPDYVDTPSRATTKKWTNGATVWIYSNNTKLGVATYNGSTWSLVTETRLSGSGTCKAVHIDGVSATSATTVTIDATSAVYEGSGGWSVSGNTLTLSANLSPSLGRLRLKGSNGTAVSLSGLTTYSSFNISTGSFNTSTAAATTSIQSSGYTPYIYGTLAGSTISTNGYTMTCPSGMMQPGTSGWVNYPTASSHTGWVSGSAGGSHEAVDLGLSVKWATCNVGASKPEDYGDYFAWGEIEPYYTEGHSQDNPCSNWRTGKEAGYGWPSYKWCNGSGTTMTKYCTDSKYIVDNKTVLDPEDDVAHVKWGGSWRMPTKAEQVELRTNCTWTWTTQNGVKGYKVTSKTNGNSLFLPAAGYRIGSSLGLAGSDGIYWSSSLYSGSPYYACELHFDSGNASWGDNNRYYGHTVRPVCQ